MAGSDPEVYLTALRRGTRPSRHWTMSSSSSKPRLVSRFESPPRGLGAMRAPYSRAFGPHQSSGSPRHTSTLRRRPAPLLASRANHVCTRLRRASRTLARQGRRIGSAPPGWSASFGLRSAPIADSCSSSPRTLKRSTKHTGTRAPENWLAPSTGWFRAAAAIE